jgi:DNA-directed RNA polymerase subunit RPC12/RpoP
MSLQCARCSAHLPPRQARNAEVVNGKVTYFCLRCYRRLGTGQPIPPAPRNQIALPFGDDGPFWYPVERG